MKCHSYHSQIISLLISLSLVAFALGQLVEGATNQTLYDPDNYGLYDVTTGSGSTNISGGRNDAYDGAYILRINGVNYDAKDLLLVGRNIVASGETLSNLRVTRKIYVPASKDGELGNFGRWYDALYNPTGMPITVSIEYYSNLGSDSSTVITRTGDGDTIVEIKDSWVATDDYDGGGDPPLAHVIYISGGEEEPDFCSGYNGSDVISWRYDNVRIEPGQTIAFLTFAIQEQTRAKSWQEAEGIVASLNSKDLNSVALRGLSQTEYKQLVNTPPPPGLQVSAIEPPEDFNSVGDEGNGPEKFNPPCKEYILTNTSPDSLDWVIEPNVPWLSVDPNSGTLSGGDNIGVTICLNESVADLDPNTYSGKIFFRDLTSGFSQERNAALTVKKVPGEIDVEPNEVDFGDVIFGLSKSEKRQVTISNIDLNHRHELIVEDISLGNYLEDFNDGQAQDWQAHTNGTWDVVFEDVGHPNNGEYKPKAASNGKWMQSTFIGKKWKDFSTKVKIRKNYNDYSEAGIFVRASDDFSYIDGKGSAYIIDISDWLDGWYYRISKYVSGSHSYLQDWTLSSYLNSGEAGNVIEIVIEGSTIKVYFNGNLEWSGNDTDIAGPGRIGLLAYQEYTNYGYYFDDVRVKEQGLTDGFELGVLPRGGPPWELKTPYDSNEPNSIVVDVNFAPGDVREYQSVLVIKSDDEDELVVEVKLKGKGIRDYLVIEPNESSVYKFSGHPGGPFFPWNTSYELYNDGPNDIEWSAEPNVDWLDVNPTGGTLEPNESILVTVMPNAQAESLPEGYHCGDVNFTDITTTVIQKRGVCLDIYSESKIWTSPQYFDVTLAYGETETKILTIGNTGSAPLSFALSGRQTSFTPLLAQKPASAVAQFEMGEEKMVLEYEFGRPIVSRRDDYDWVKIEGLEQYLRVGAPIVPVCPVKVLVPFSKEVAAIRVVVVDEQQLDGRYYLPPAQSPYPIIYEGVVEATKPDPAVYGQPVPWPGVYHADVTAQSKRGYQLFILNLFPLQYIPTTGEISYATKLRLEIDLVDAPNSDVLRPSDKVKAELAASVDNPSVLKEYPETGTLLEKLDGPSTLPSGGPYQYVIITNETLKSASGQWNFQALRDAKIAKGVTATIVTTEWIYAKYGGTRPDGDSDNQTRIRNFLMDAYQNWGTEYVLLGGTNDIVPARMFWVESKTTPNEIDTMPVDMYYGCVEPATCTFDYDADSLYGEPTDGVGGGDIDLCAEIYVGRATVANAAELANFIRKTLTYDSTELKDTYLPRVTMLGECLNEYIPVYAKPYMEQIRLGGDYDGYFTCGFENHLQTHFIDFNTVGCLPGSPSCCWPLYDKDSTWEISKLLDLMNGGIHIFNHLGHANYTSDMKLDTSDLSILTNTDYFFVYSQGCMPGGFDTSNCFTEVITSMEHGAFAAVMNARFGWYRNDGTDGPSQRFNRQFWDAILCEDMLEMGRANQDSKEDNLWDINGECIRWCYYELNLFGDPEQQFRFTDLNRRPYDPNASWLEFEPDAGTVSPGGVNDVNVIFDANLPPGTYDGYITISSEDVCDIEIPVRMTVEPSDYFTELFEADYFEPNNPNCNDMKNRTLIFVPDGSSNYYSACSSEAACFPVDPNGGTIISLGDDDYEPVTLQDPDVNFYGTNYDTFFISSNGYITFASPDIRCTESLVDHFTLPRISALFDDLNPSAGGTISWKQLSDRIAVTFENVPEYSLSNSNSFQVELFFNGMIRITWLNIDSLDGLVGLSEGMELPADFVESDLSEYRLSGDIDGDCAVDFADFATLASYWLSNGCTAENDWCGGTDINRNGKVDLEDLSECTMHWLECIRM